MASDFRTIRMSELSSLEAYTLLASTVVPRPIAFVSTCNTNGVANLAPFSFFMVGGANPPSLMYSPTLNKLGEEKDSLRNVRELGEFVVNTVHRDMAEGMNLSSLELPADQSEWELCGFDSMPSDMVRPPRVRESLCQFECKVFDIVAHGDGPSAARYVIGEVLCVHLSSEIADNPGAIRPISRLGGPSYLDTSDGGQFSLVRPIL